MTAAADNLDSLPDAQLDELFRREVCGWYPEPCNKAFWRTHHPKENDPFEGYIGKEPSHYHSRSLPPFCASADSVLPWLEKWDWDCAWNRADYLIRIFKYPRHNREDAQWWAAGKTFARCAVIALLRARRAEKGAQP